MVMGALGVLATIGYASSLRLSVIAYNYQYCTTPSQYQYCSTTQSTTASTVSTTTTSSTSTTSSDDD